MAVENIVGSNPMGFFFTLPLASFPSFISQIQIHFNFNILEVVQELATLSEDGDA